VLQSESIDLLITDVRMPVMDGVTLVRRMVEIGMSLPSIVFVSGFGDVDRKEMYALGVEAFLSKPFDREELLGVIERALAERSSLWLTPMPVAPRQSMLVQAQDIGEGSSEESVHLGRGGFSAHYAGSLSLSKVAFQCSFPAKQRQLTGQGYVRWSSRADQTIGIEFTFLDEPCRSWLLEEIAAANPRSFIPSI